MDRRISTRHISVLRVSTVILTWLCRWMHPVGFAFFSSMVARLIITFEVAFDVPSSAVAIIIEGNALWPSDFKLEVITFLFSIYAAYTSSGVSPLPEWDSAGACSPQASRCAILQAPAESFTCANVTKAECKAIMCQRASHQQAGRHLDARTLLPNKVTK